MFHLELSKLQFTEYFLKIRPKFAPKITHQHNGCVTLGKPPSTSMYHNLPKVLHVTLVVQSTCIAFLDKLLHHHQKR